MGPSPRNNFLTVVFIPTSTCFLSNKWNNRHHYKYNNITLRLAQERCIKMVTSDSVETIRLAGGSNSKAEYQAYNINATMDNSRSDYGQEISHKYHSSSITAYRWVGLLNSWINFSLLFKTPKSLKFISHWIHFFVSTRNQGKIRIVFK